MRYQTSSRVLANQIVDEVTDARRTELCAASWLSSQPRSKVYVQEGKDRTAVTEQVPQLMSLNKITKDAQELTDALTGNALVQATWSVWVIEKMLSSSGLMQDEHYLLQEKTREDGSRARRAALANLVETA